MKNWTQSRAHVTLGACVALTYVFASGALGAAPLAAFTATYSVRAGGLKVGEMTRALSLYEPAQYRFETTIESSGLLKLVRHESIQESSSGDLLGDEIRPRHYVYRRSSKSRQRETEIAFDWDKHRITTIVQGQRWEMDAMAGTLDKLVYQLVLMRDLINDKAPLVYTVADGGKLKSYEITRLGEESVEFDGAPVRTIKVAYLRQDSQRRTTLWCAPAQGYLPIQIEYREDDGGITTARLTKLVR
ncbi:MAG: DUF3108 domain-containing protein [Gammaproteobacteria bacterium]|nr:DUF3108 domain-containing protein [Gammaproteobacteria bacterium]